MNYHNKFASIVLVFIDTKLCITLSVTEYRRGNQIYTSRVTQDEDKQIKNTKYDVPPPHAPHTPYDIVGEKILTSYVYTQIVFLFNLCRFF